MTLALFHHLFATSPIFIPPPITPLHSPHPYSPLHTPRASHGPSQSPPSGLPRLAAPERAFARARAARGRRLVVRARHVLRWRRRVRHHGRSVWVREPVQPGVRDEHGGAEHGAVQRWAELRAVLRGALLPGRGQPRVPAGICCGDRDQLLPAQQRPPSRGRRLVQPASCALRPLPACLPLHRPVQGWHCPHLLPQGSVQEEGRHPFHHQRPLVLQSGARDQRRWRWRRARPGRPVRPRRLASHVAQLGPELAEQRAPRRPVSLLPRHRRRRPHRRLQRGGPARMVVRADVQWGPVRLKTYNT